MTLSECLKLLHSYIGTDCDNQDYIVYLQTLIMRAPATEAEEKADDENNYYPYKGATNEKDFLLRVYNGSKQLPKKKARMIKKYYSPVDFKAAFSDIEDSARSNFVNELHGKGINCTNDELPDYCEELLRLLIDAAAVGVSEIDVALIGENEATLSVYDDTNLKKKYGVHLLAETNNHCPYDGCFKPLRIGTAPSNMFDYSIVRINPKITVETVDNLIALCPECGRRYRVEIDEEKQYRLEDIKLRLSSMKEAMDILAEDKIVAGIERVIGKIPGIPIERIMELNYKPTQVANKMDKTDPALFMKINTYVSGYYPDVRDLFKQAEVESGFNFEKFCSQVKFKFTDIKDSGLTQGQMFDELVDWLSGATNEDREPCEVIISYFVQKCEVFDVIS
ncbi:MAG: ABC-three component system protein [Butyrivibrio sp.]